MKQITFFMIMAFLISESACAQKAQRFVVNDIPVFLKPTVKDIVNVNVYFLGGVTNYGADKAGIEDLALAGTAQCGTKKYTKDAFQNMADKFGIAISGNSSRDYGVITLNCIKKYFDEGWDLLSSATTEPVFAEKDFELLKQKVLAGIKNSDASPDSKILKMAVSATFAGTPYATDPAGETNTVQNISAQEVKDYYFNTLLNKNRIFIVAAGNISEAEITEKIKTAFGDLSAKPYVKYDYKVPEITGNKLNVEDRKLATNYIVGVMNAPLFTSEDYAANRLAIASLSDDLFTEIRTKRNLSYAPYAVSVRGKMPYSYVYVSTTDPKASVQVMTDEINRFRKSGFSEKDFKDIRNLFITATYMKEESTSAMASSLGVSEVLGNWRMDDEFIDKIQKVTPAMMTDALRKYVKGINWNYLGNKDQAEAAKSAFEMKIE